VTVTDLMEQGIRAFTRGETAEAERLWREVLRLDPFHDRAQSYLSLVESRRGPAVPLPAPAAPAPRAAAPIRGPAPDRAPSPPVPLPAPGSRQTGPAWMRPPITLPPTAAAV
jgi:hypothetical protein